MVILLCAADRGRTDGWILQELRNDDLKGQSPFPVALYNALAMINNYSAVAPMTQNTSGYEGVEFSQVEAGTNTFIKRQVKETSAVGAPAQQGNRKTRDKSGVVGHNCQKKGHYSYRCQYPAPIPINDAAIMHLNVAV